jgi:hypothetical protein
MFGLVEQALGGFESLRLALGILAHPLQVLPCCGKFGD